jgi:hypothetical protein
MAAYDVEHIRLGNQYIRPRERLYGAKCQQTWISGSGTEEGDVP